MKANKAYEPTFIGKLVGLQLNGMLFIFFCQVFFSVTPKAPLSVGEVT